MSSRGVAIARERLTVRLSDGSKATPDFVPDLEGNPGGVFTPFITGNFGVANGLTLKRAGIRAGFRPDWHPGRRA